MKAALEHEFNCHEFCSLSWCKYFNLTPQECEELNLQNGSKLKNKTEHLPLYQSIKEVHDMFLTNDNLKMLNHHFNSQKMKP